jgi:hypothetical protein
MITNIAVTQTTPFDTLQNGRWTRRRSTRLALPNNAPEPARARSQGRRGSARTLDSPSGKIVDRWLVRGER